MKRYKFCFFVPETHTEQVKMAVFATGAGKIGDYDCCSWQVAGQGQFRPLEGSQPFIGQQGDVEKVQEHRVEMICEAAYIKQAVAAMKQAHPYEEPAFDVVELVEID